MTGHSPITLSSYLSRGTLNVGGDFVQAQRWPFCAGHNGGDSLQKVGQVSRHCASLVAVKFRKGLGLKVLEHKQGILPYKVDLEKRQKADHSVVRAKAEREKFFHGNNTDEVTIY